jgi:hypothetical protein
LWRQTGAQPVPARAQASQARSTLTPGEPALDRLAMVPKWVGPMSGLLAVCFFLGMGRLVAAPGTASQVSAAADVRRTLPLFGIGRGEKDAHTHVVFETPKDVVFASVHVVVDRTASAGLNFFALQVNFKNGTWAHGGLQDVDRTDGKAGPRVRQVNWGGLVDRGGGTADYDQRNDRADLEKIQNPAIGQHRTPGRTASSTSTWSSAVPELPCRRAPTG